MKHVTSGQTRLLLHLRWTMVRQPRSRLGLALLAGSALGLLVGAVLAGARLSDAGDRSFGIALVLPSLLLGFALSAFISPLAAGGGNQLFPPEQLAAFPLRASAHFRSSLLLTPINLAWLLQVVALAGATAFVTGPSPRLILALLVIGTYVGFVTVAGQAAAWWIVGLRQQRAGRAALLSIAGLLLIGAAALLISERVIEVLDRSPTTLVVTAMANAYAGEPVLWLPHVTALALASCVAYLAGVRACAWTLRTPSLVSRSHDARTYRRRARAVTPLGEMLAVDRANVWRSTSMRRGLYVLGLLPGVVAALVGVRWVDLPLLPALVAAGAGMLFGVNAFCLDGSGALWLASLPTTPRALFLVRTATVVTGEPGHRFGGYCCRQRARRGSAHGHGSAGNAVLCRFRPVLGHGNVHAAVHYAAVPSRSAGSPRYACPTRSDGGLFRAPCHRVNGYRDRLLRGGTPERPRPPTDPDDLPRAVVASIPRDVRSTLAGPAHPISGCRDGEHGVTRCSRNPDRRCRRAVPCWEFGETGPYELVRARGE